jgi:hypothetical protein
VPMIRKSKKVMSLNRSTRPWKYIEFYWGQGCKGVLRYLMHLPI